MILHELGVGQEEERLCTLKIDISHAHGIAQQQAPYLQKMGYGRQQPICKSGICIRVNKEMIASKSSGLVVSFDRSFEATATKSVSTWSSYRLEENI